MAKRGKGEGSLYKRKSDGRWVGELTLPDGTQKYLYGRTRAIASARLFEAQQRLKHGQPLPDERLTVAKYLEEWIQKKDGKAATLKRYGDIIRCHFIPAWGRIALARLTVDQVEAFYRQKLAEGLAWGTIRTMRGVLHTALQDALRREKVTRNVADLAKLPKEPEETAPPLEPLTPEEANALLKVAHEQGDRFEALYWLAVTTGMREGELLGLCWPEVDLAHGTIQVRRTLSLVHGAHLDPPKSKTSRRTILLTAQAIEALKVHQDRQKWEQKHCPHWGDGVHDLVFPNTVGRAQSIPDFLCDHFQPLLHDAGLRKVTFHLFRHTAISWLLRQGIPLPDVAAYVGHANTATTLRTYSHPLADSQKRIVDAMERTLAEG